MITTSHYNAYIRPIADSKKLRASIYFRTVSNLFFPMVGKTVNSKKAAREWIKATGEIGPGKK